LLCFDVTNRDTFINLEEWIKEAERYMSDANAKNILIVGCKADLVYERVVSYEEVKKYCDLEGFTYIDVSPKQKINVEKAVMILIQQLVLKVQSQKRVPQQNNKKKCTIM